MAWIPEQQQGDARQNMRAHRSDPKTGFIQHRDRDFFRFDRSADSIGTLLSASTIPNSLYIVQVDTVVDGAGVGTTSAYFKNPGAVDIPAFAVDTIDTPLPGITSVTNPTDGVTGQTRETDSELRVRREQSLFTNSIALIDSVDSGVREVTGVTDCRVFENYTDATNIDGIPAHSIMVVTEEEWIKR